MSDEHRDEKGDEVASRLSRRFESETTEKPDTRDSPENPDVPDNPDNLGGQDTPEKVEKSNTSENADESDNLDNPANFNPKEAWTARNVYVPDGTAVGPDLLQDFDGEYRRMQYECDWEVRKQTHYYPVVIQQGTERVSEMSGEEFTAAVEELGLR